MNLSENFTLEEFVRSQTAARRNIDNTPLQNHIDNAVALAQNVLQPLRNALGPVIVTSGYRSETLNAAVGGSPRSQHRFGEAADIVINGVPTPDVCKWIINNVAFDQIILEFYEPGNINSGWTHVSYTSRGSNRKEVLTAARMNGVVEYSYGLNY